MLVPVRALAPLLLCAAVSLPSVSAQSACGTTLANTDYDEGSGGPDVQTSDAAACCAACAAAGAGACWAAGVSTIGTGCWFKTQAQTRKGGWNPQAVACWPAGRTPPPAPSPPPPPPPPKYTASLLSAPADPVISYQAGQTAWPQSFNPAYVQASPGTAGKRGLLVRSQNCSFTPGVCQGCNPRGPSDPVFRGSVITFAQLRSDGTFAQPYLVFAPDGSAAEDFGTEDPRLTLDESTGLYHLFYTCYSSSLGPRLCHATTTDPTAPYPGVWTRLGDVFPADGPGTKSGALLIRPAPPHYLIWGAGHISLATSDDLTNWTTVNDSYIMPRGAAFDNQLVEAGPSPMLLSDGNYVFLHNSDNSTRNCYNAEFSIISGQNPALVLQRAPVPLISPTRDWELGVAPAQCNVGCVVFLEAATPVLGQPNTYDVYFGGSDAVIGTARVKISIASD